MIQKIIYSLLIIISAILISCTPSQKKEATASDTNKKMGKNQMQDTGNMLIFNKIDNSVKVFVNDSIIFDSGSIDNNPGLDFKVDLTSFLRDKEATLSIQLYNGYEPYHQQLDPLWEVRYDLILDGEIVDFVLENGDDNALGLVYENKYRLSEWIPSSN